MANDFFASFMNQSFIINTKRRSKLKKSRMQRTHPDLLRERSFNFFIKCIANILQAHNEHKIFIITEYAAEL
jgi:hypothetical protein